MRSPTVAFIAAMLWAPAVGAQETAAPVATVAGSWTYVAESRDVIGEAIQRGTADMNFVTRPIARRRLSATNEPYRALTIEVADGEVATSYDGRTPIRSPADGTAVPWHREGEELSVTTSLAAGGLVQTFTAEDGARENEFSVSADGQRLTLRVTLRSPRLPAPIVYRLLYDRAS